MPRDGKTIAHQRRWRAIALSLLLHSGIVAAAVYGWFTWKHRPPPVTTLAIEATVVDERALKGIAPTPKPEPPPPEPDRLNPNRRRRGAGSTQAGPGGDSSAREQERLAQEKRAGEARAGAEGAQELKSAKKPSASKRKNRRRRRRPPKRRRPRRLPRTKRRREEASRGGRRREEGRRRKGARARARRNFSAVARGRRAGQCRPQQRRGHALACADRRAHPAGLDQATLGTAGHLLYCVGHPGSGRRGDSRPGEQLQRRRRGVARIGGGRGVSRLAVAAAARSGCRSSAIWS